MDTWCTIDTPWRVSTYYSMPIDNTMVSSHALPLSPPDTSLQRIHAAMRTAAISSSPGTDPEFWQWVMSHTPSIYWSPWGVKRYLQRVHATLITSQLHQDDLDRDIGILSTSFEGLRPKVGHTVHCLHIQSSTLSIYTYIHSFIHTHTYEYILIISLHISAYHQPSL